MLLSGTLNGKKVCNIEASSDLITEVQKVELQKSVDRLCLRKKRNALISKYDWTQMPDAPLTQEQKVVWSEYRQALRDLPQQFENIHDAVWPVAPNA
ncbi:tail fiber assembly protein [Pseudoalteromonas sp. AS84]|uniref:tail fiber assembly protein n=1 Tax=Pseudoalteromonas sp. AS84 TaxID=3135778 RepID=UPI0031777776